MGPSVVTGGLFVGPASKTSNPLSPTSSPSIVTILCPSHQQMPLSLPAVRFRYFVYPPFEGGHLLCRVSVMSASFNQLPLNPPSKPVHLPLIVERWGYWGFERWLDKTATVVSGNQSNTSPRTVFTPHLLLETCSCLFFISLFFSPQKANFSKTTVTKWLCNNKSEPDCGQSLVQSHPSEALGAGLFSLPMCQVSYVLLIQTRTSCNDSVTQQQSIPESRCVRCSTVKLSDDACITGFHLDHPATRLHC